MCNTLHPIHYHATKYKHLLEVCGNYVLTSRTPSNLQWRFSMPVFWLCVVGTSRSCVDSSCQIPEHYCNVVFYQILQKACTWLIFDEKKSQWFLLQRKRASNCPTLISSWWRDSLGWVTTSCARCPHSLEKIHKCLYIHSIVSSISPTPVEETKGGELRVNQVLFSFFCLSTSPKVH